MLRRFLLISIALSSTFAAEVRDVHYRGYLAPRNIVPTFDRGYVVASEDNGTVSQYAPDGTLIRKVTAQVPGTDSTIILNVAADTDGTLVAALQFWGRKTHRGGGIAIFAAGASQARLFDICSH